MKRACIDIGSNSILLILADVSDSGIKEILNEANVTSLGKDLDKNKFFLNETMDATFEVLKEYKVLLEKNNFSVEDTIVTATEASRVSTNSADFFKKVKNELGFEVTIISPEGEAFYTAKGVVSSLKTDQESIVVMDIGGASTELIKISLKPFEILSSISLPVGSVRAMDWAKDGIFEEKMTSLLTSNLENYSSSSLICVAGTMTSLASIYKGNLEYNAENIEGLKIGMDIFPQFLNDLKNTTPENMKLLFPYLEKRIPMLPHGAEVCLRIAKFLKVNELVISTRGLRYGVIKSGQLSDKFQH